MKTNTTVTALKRLSCCVFWCIVYFMVGVNSRGADDTANLVIQRHEAYQAAVEVMAQALVDNEIAICIARTLAVGEIRPDVAVNPVSPVHQAGSALQVVEYIVAEVLRGALESGRPIFVDRGDWDMASKSVGYNFSGRGEHSILFTKPAEYPSAARRDCVIMEKLTGKVGETINEAILMEATGQKVVDWKNLLKELGLDTTFTEKTWVKLTPAEARLRVGLPPFSVEKDRSWELNREHYEAGLRRSKEIDVMLKTLILEKELVDDIKLLLNRGVGRLGAIIESKVPTDMSALDGAINDILDIEKELKSPTARDVTERIVERALKVSTIMEGSKSVDKQE